MSVFSHKLAKLMLEYNLDDEKLGKRLGVNRTTIARWRTGVRSPAMKKLPDIADIFGVSPDFFIIETAGEGGAVATPEVFLAEKEQVLLNSFNRLSPLNQDSVISFTEQRLEEQISITADAHDEKEYWDDLKTSRLPIYTNLQLAAGNENWDAELLPPELWEIPTKLLRTGAAFGARISGESMSPEYPDGAYALIRPETDWSVTQGNVCAVWEDGEAYIKLVDDGYLVSLNKVKDKTGKRVFPDRKLRECSDTRLVGIVTGVFDQNNYIF